MSHGGPGWARTPEEGSRRVSLAPPKLPLSGEGSVHFRNPPRILCSSQGSSRGGLPSQGETNSSLTACWGFHDPRPAPPLPPSPLVGPAGKTLGCGWSSSRVTPRGKLEEESRDQPRQWGGGGPEAGACLSREVVLLAAPPAQPKALRSGCRQRNPRLSPSLAATLPGRSPPPRAGPRDACWEL